MAGYGGLGGVPVQWQTFLDTPPDEGDPERARVFVISAPYDGSTSFKAGARQGPAAIIDASRHLEDYDLELGRDISEIGIYTAPALTPNVSGPEGMIANVKAAVGDAARRGKLTALLGGEHSVSVGAVQAFAEIYDDLSVLYLDAHADMRDCYMGSRWGHASAARRISEICPVTLAGVRSISAEEMRFVRERGIAAHFRREQAGDAGEAIKKARANLSANVYVSIDLDVLDPSIMAAVGTPEPNGFSWNEVTRLLRAVAWECNIVGFDLVELSPGEGPVACAFTAAKLAYRMMGYATERRGGFMRDVNA